ncbi:hypothetical protein, partial [Vibrio parahaemolyticus]|uniref:hypothetical protein n=1 Tax=Vibrio parahaemolyticus TaxID=670 RepID=UPI001C5DDFF5
ADATPAETEAMSNRNNFISHLTTSLKKHPFINENSFCAPFCLSRSQYQEHFLFTFVLADNSERALYIQLTSGIL